MHSVWKRISTASVSDNTKLHY